MQLDVETADEPLRVHDLHGIFTAYPFAGARPLRERPALDRQRLAMNWNGARIGAFDTYMDTPYYEQLQYVGDTRIQGLISLYVAGDDRLVRQAIAHFDDSRIPEGITASRYPSALAQLIPPFSLIYVAMVHDYHMHRDDPAFVRRMLAGSPRHPRLVRAARGLDGHARPDALLELRRLGASAGGSACRRARTTATRRRSACSTRTRFDRAAALEAGRRRAGDGRSLSRARRLGRAARRARARGTRRAASSAIARAGLDSATFSQQTNVLAILADAVPAAERRARDGRACSPTRR